MKLFYMNLALTGLLWSHIYIFTYGNVSFEEFWPFFLNQYFISFSKTFLAFLIYDYNFWNFVKFIEGKSHCMGILNLLKSCYIFYSFSSKLSRKKIVVMVTKIHVKISWKPLEIFGNDSLFKLIWYKPHSLIRRSSKGCQFDVTPLQCHAVTIGCHAVTLLKVLAP